MDRLDDNAAGVLRDQLLKSTDVVQFPDVHVRDQRLEWLLVLGIARDAERAHAASVERVLEAHDVVLCARVLAAAAFRPNGLSIAARHFECALVRFRSRISEEHLDTLTARGFPVLKSQATPRTRELHQRFSQLGCPLVVVYIARVDKFTRFLADDLHDNKNRLASLFTIDFQGMGEKTSMANNCRARSGRQ